MPFHRLRRRLQGQGGHTLVELLVAMPIATLLLGIVVQALGTASTTQQDVERRSTALTQGQIGLERLTREVRQADWLYFRSSSVVDMDVTVRVGSTTTGSKRLVRYDCTGETCVREEGAAVSYPPPASPAFYQSDTVIGGDAGDKGGRYGQITDHDIFVPSSIDPNTGVRSNDWQDPDYLLVHLRLTIRDRTQPLVLEDGVSLRNQTGFAG